MQTAILWTLALAVVPWGIFAAEHRLGLAGTRFSGHVGIGAAIFALAGTLGLVSSWSIVTRGRGTPLPLDPTRRLVIHGPYRWVRNPMAIAGLTQAVGVGVAIGSSCVLAYVLAGGLLWNFGVRRWEERDLLARFGAEYEIYRNEVRCWWPRLRPLPARE